jgi:hypothetical protein
MNSFMTEHFDEVDLLAVLAEFRKLLRLDDVHDHFLWSLGFRSAICVCFCSSELIGAELGSHAPLRHVFTPKRGSTHTFRMIQVRRTAMRIGISIVASLFFQLLIV